MYLYVSISISIHIRIYIYIYVNTYVFMSLLMLALPEGTAAPQNTPPLRPTCWGGAAPQTPPAPKGGLPPPRPLLKPLLNTGQGQRRGVSA